MPVSKALVELYGLEKLEQESMLNKSIFDVVVALAALFTSLVLFFIQSGEMSTRDYFIVLSPTAIAAIVLLGHVILKPLKKKFEGLVAARDYLNRIENVFHKNSCTINILNENGDILWNRSNKLTIVKDGLPVRTTDKQSVFTCKKLSEFPPKARVIQSGCANRTLKPSMVEKSRTLVNGISHYNYGWLYSIFPPLTTKDDYLEFQFETNMPDEEKMAFTEQGSLFFFHSNTTYCENDCTIIAPINYYFEVLDYFMEDSNGKRLKIKDNTLKPNLSANNRVLSWSPPYRPHTKFITKYKLVKYTPNQPLKSDS